MLLTSKYYIPIYISLLHWLISFRCLKDKEYGGLAAVIESTVKTHHQYDFSVQFSSVAQSCPTLCDSKNRNTLGLPIHHQLSEFTQTHVHWVSDAMQPSHPRSSPSPSAPNPSQHQSLLQWVNSSHEVAKVLEFQLQYHSFQRIPRTDLL